MIPSAPVRALAAFVALPGTVAFAVPVIIASRADRPVGHPATALVVLSVGTLLLLWCVREFYVAGRGTLAPWDPPRRLVTTGPYRLSRNPMYLGVLTILAGWCLLWSARALLYYALGTLCVFYLRVRLAEEPWASRRFGAEWEAYRARVPRWLI
jgi:protein-S-isoprenylcysteine O-methyltransferase Ste14